MRSEGFEPKLRFCDDPMFKRVMEREDICKGVLERILARPIDEVEYHNTEQERRLGPNGKSIRMDSYLVESGGRVYDVEMQMTYNPALALRFRGYQSVLDGSFLKRGGDYGLLRESYVIFICMDDPLGGGLPIYTIERQCAERSQVPVDCGAHWIALNASAYDALAKGDGLRRLLEYVYTGEAASGDSLLREIDEEVARNNADKEWAAMMFDSITIAEEEAMIRGRAQGFETGLEEGRTKGRAEGENRYASLVRALLDAGRIEDVRRASDDAEQREKLYAEFGI